MKRIMDAGGLLQFYTGWREPSPVMLLEYTLYETVDREKLQKALEKAIMCVNLIEQACEKSIVPELQRMLAEYKVVSSVTDLRERFYDFFPMEELISVGGEHWNT